MVESPHQACHGSRLVDPGLGPEGARARCELTTRALCGPSSTGRDGTMMARAPSLPTVIDMCLGGPYTCDMAEITTSRPELRAHE